MKHKISLPLLRSRCKIFKRIFMNNILRCLPNARELLQVQHCFLCIEEENDWLFRSLQLMRDYGGRNFARAQNNKNMARTESCWPQGMQFVSNGFFWGQIFITWQQKESSATHTKYLCESIFVPPKLPQSCQNLRNIFF